MEKPLEDLDVDGPLEQRIAVLRRYRKLLELQRGHLQDYLDLLDTREDAISQGDVGRLEAYAEIEQGIVRGIMAVQSCIEPLTELYRRAAPEGSPDIDELQGRLEALRRKVLARNEESVALLRGKMDELRQQIQGLRIPRGPRQVYSDASEPQLLNISG